ncbi:sensor histidine kinase [Ekhidna sp.]|uniref:sensor histidine kinase n=1 Tax=Ekhidna sp. TaxID=2608089 RepID=UPI003B500135
MPELSKERIKAFRDEIINRTLLVGCIIAVFTYLISLIQFTANGFELSFVTDLLVVITICIVTYYRKSLDIKLKSTIILIGIYAVVMVDMFEIGVLSANKVLLILIPFFAFISLSTTRSFVYVFITSASVLVLAFLHIDGILEPIPYEELGLIAWSIHLLLILLVAYFIVYIVIKFNKEYEALISDLSMRNNILKENEIELAQYRDELEDIVKQRTEELNKSNKKLRKQKERLAETVQNLEEAKEELVQTEKNAALSSLSSGLAHELNNPLNFIKGGVDVLEIFLNKNLDENQKEDVERLVESIKEGVDRSTKIVEGLNQYSTVLDNVQDCDINEIISNSVEMLHNQLDGKINIFQELDDAAPKIKGDKYQFYQLFLNLIQNAIDAIDKTGSIYISSKINTNTIDLRIHDTGAGVSKKKLKRLFDPFYTTKEIGKGTGLGLFICSSIVKNHNGKLEFESELNKGTSVNIILPHAS